MLEILKGYIGDSAIDITMKLKWNSCQRWSGVCFSLHCKDRQIKINQFNLQLVYSRARFLFNTMNLAHSVLLIKPISMTNLQMTAKNNNENKIFSSWISKEFKSLLY
jgi:hypothetical protein